MITGYPCSGKTMRTNQLVKGLEEKIKGTDYKITVVDDDKLGIPKENYRNAQTEKALRGAQLSAVKRSISKTEIVILDGLTYIKGFRYQLFCEAKALSTNSCVIHVGAPEELCKEWNKARPETEQWPESLMDALIFRYEEPNGMSRWDSPLFTLPYADDDVPTDDIWNALIKKAKPPNQATVLKAAPPTNYLTELDRVTMDVVNATMTLFNENPGGTVNILNYPEPVTLPMRLTLAQMHRIRRNFIALNKMKPMDIDRIQNMFIEHLSKYWDNV